MASPFAKTTFGPPAPSGQDTDKGALIADVASGFIDMVDQDGNTHALETMLTLLQAQTALVTITTAQTLFTKNLKAGALNKSGRTLFISGIMIFSTAAANTPTITIAIQLGGTAICTITSAATTASTANGQLLFSFTISTVTLGATGTVEAHGQLQAQILSALGSAVPDYIDQNTAPSAAINLTSALALTATIAGAGGTIASAQLRQLFIEMVG